MPLSEANIVIRELQRGISTNIKGEFEFENINKGDYTLYISFIGYHDKKVKKLATYIARNASSTSKKEGQK